MSAENPARPGYRADRGRRETVYLAAGGYALFSLFTLTPVFLVGQSATLPGWSKLILLVSLLQLAYAAWLALAPDWSSLWVATLSLAAVAVLYAAGLSILLNASPDRELLLGLSDLLRLHGRKPALWCFAVVLLASLQAYLAGAVSYRWHKLYRAAHGGK